MSRERFFKIERDETPNIELVIQQGETYMRCFALVETLDPWTLLNLSGWTARASIRKTFNDPILLDMTTSNGMITLGPQGTPPDDYNVLIMVDSTTTAALTDWGVGVWSMRLRDPLGRSYRYVEGRARFSRAATG